MIMHFLLVTAIFLEIFVEYNAQISGDVRCGDGEEYDMCRSPCETKCDDVRRGIIQNNCSLPCIQGCFCRRGLVRADDYTCVPPSVCITPECQENEEYLDCGSPCALNCSNLNSPIFCAKPCYRGCFCKPDFVRDSRGKCIDERNCRLDGNVQCPVNEEYVNCINFCNTCFISEYCQTPYCTSGCDCKPGYFRSIYGQCITEEECIAEEHALQQQCGLNEIYTDCVNPCNDCYYRGKCDDYSYNYCSPGCDCKPGYFRNDDWICVPEWNCLRDRQPVCVPGEEYYDCIPTCRVTCETYNTPDMICDTTCNRGCFCKRGFIRRDDGLCVQPSECPAKPPLCPAGEIFHQCVPTCRTTCRTLNISRGLCSTECRQGCFCQPGFVRNDYGVCVPPSECPFVCGPNEEFRTCGSACPASCESLRERSICQQQTCLRGCFCRTGFVLGPRGKCIRPRNCPVRTAIPCCAGLGGRNIGNGTDEDDTTPITEMTTVTTEVPSNESLNADTTTEPSTITKKVPDKTRTKTETATTTTPKIEDIKTTTPKPEDVKATTPKPKDVKTTPPKPEDVKTTTPKPEAPIITSRAAADTTAVAFTMPVENKTEPVNTTVSATETSVVSVTDGQTNNTHLTTNSITANSTEIP